MGKTVAGKTSSCERDMILKGYDIKGICLMTPTCFTLGTQTLYWLHRLLASHPILTTSLYSCYLMKLLYNMILLTSNAHSIVINQHCRALPVLSRALILLLLMISGNVYVHPGPSTIDSHNSDLCPVICFTYLCSHKSLGFLPFNIRSLLPKMYQKCGFTAPIQMCWSLQR